MLFTASRSGAWTYRRPLYTRTGFPGAFRLPFYTSSSRATLQFPPNSYFPSSPSTAYESFQAHADLTGNASSQAIVGFLHSTGYHSVAPIDQAKAQLYLTFAAHGRHKGAQMALGYRYWSGIGVGENCLAALDWYEEAAEQGMSNLGCGAFSCSA